MPKSERIHKGIQALLNTLRLKGTRSAFFSTLSHVLREQFPYDRLCINLYDQSSEMLIYFTAAEGTVVSTLSPVRPAEAASTVAGMVIASRKPVIITDIARHFATQSIHPMAESGLTTTMAFPLMVGNEIIATLHCSFAEKPDDIYYITSYLLELSPFIAVCMGAILSLERLREGDPMIPERPLLNSLPPAESLIFDSAVMRDVVRKINMVAHLDIPIMLLGETGTGKTLISQFIHHRSKRKAGAFVKVNCPALATNLFESELFGHTKGAFTGASTKRTGRFELANHGTLFLDEVAEITPEMQSKLLQVLDDCSFERVGESVPLAVDVRIISATNVTIAEALDTGRLRSDFYYRLAVCAIELPPLRNRPQDIPPLANYMSAEIASRLSLAPIKLSPRLLEPLMDYAWPGNIRELRNVLHKLIIHQHLHGTIDQQAIQELILEGKQRPASAKTSAAVQGTSAQKSSPQSPLCSLAEAERQHIQQALLASGGVIAGSRGAAQLLGIHRSTLLHRMQKLGIQTSCKRQD